VQHNGDSLLAISQDWPGYVGRGGDRQPAQCDSSKGLGNGLAGDQGGDGSGAAKMPFLPQGSDELIISRSCWRPFWRLEAVRKTSPVLSHWGRRGGTTNARGRFRAFRNLEKGWGHSWRPAWGCGTGIILRDATRLGLVRAVFCRKARDSWVAVAR